MMALLNAGYTQSWDEAGMMKQSVVPAGSPVGVAGTNEYGYDVDRKRVWKKITRNSSIAEHTIYIHAGPNLIAEYPARTAAASPAQEYVYAQEIDSLVMLVRSTGGGSGNEKLTITRNQQWSVTALSDASSGSVVERYTYDHFGKRTILEPNGTTVRATSSYNMPFGYTSRQHDSETGLMYFRARYYDPHSAEFTSPDPLEYVDGMSMFRGYFGISLIDSYGFECQPVKSAGIHHVPGRGFLTIIGGDLDDEANPWPDDKDTFFTVQGMWVDATFFSIAGAFDNDDPKDECKCCCDSVGFSQIINVKAVRRHAPDQISSRWILDGGGIKYPGSDEANPCPGPIEISMKDQPSRSTYGLRFWIFQAEVCAVCLKGKEGPKDFSDGAKRVKGLVAYECAQYAFLVEPRNGKYVRTWLTEPRVIGAPTSGRWSQALIDDNPSLPDVKK